MISALNEDESARGRLHFLFVDAPFTSHSKDLDKLGKCYCGFHYSHGVLKELEVFRTYK